MGVTNVTSGGTAALPRGIPSSIYGRYKRATQCFLDWLLRARDCGLCDLNDSADGVTIADYQRIVGAIASESAALPRAMTQSWLHARAACQSAITLRARAAQYFPPLVAGDSHQHFLSRLRDWLKTLQNAPPLQKEETKRSAKGVDYNNYYEVLELPDDYFGDVEVVDPMEHVGPSKTSSRNGLFDDAFTHDLNVELGCLLLELEELAEGAYAVYHEVKKQKKTLIEATMVTKVAMDCAVSIISRLEARYPAIKTADDLITIIEKGFSSSALSTLWNKVAKAWSPQQNDKYQYVPGTFTIDFLWLGRALVNFLPCVKKDLVLRVDAEYNGEMYCEERTPNYVVPDETKVPDFLGQQLVILHNEVMFRRLEEDSEPYSMNSIVGWYLDQFRTYFTSKTVTIHLVFMVICWIRSVAALQGDGGLRRNVGVTIAQFVKLEGRVLASLHRSNTRILVEERIKLFKQLRAAQGKTYLLRANPFLTGLMLLDQQLQFIDYGSMLLPRRHIFGRSAICTWAFVIADYWMPFRLLSKPSSCSKTSYFCRPVLPSRKGLSRARFW